MTDNKSTEHYDVEAIRAFGMFLVMLLFVAMCVDFGYYQAKRFEVDSSVRLAAMTGAQALPSRHNAQKAAGSVAHSLGVPLLNWEVKFDQDNRWVQIDKSMFYETMFLKHIGVKQIPITAHAFSYKMN